MKRAKNAQEVVDWVAGILRLDVTSLHDLRTGAAAVQLLHTLYSDTFDLSRVDFDASMPYHYERNFKLLQQVMEKNGIVKEFNISRVVQGEKHRDLLMLLLWLKLHYETFQQKSARQRRERGLPDPEPYDATLERAKAEKRKRIRMSAAHPGNKAISGAVSACDAIPPSIDSDRGSKGSAFTSYSTYGMRFARRQHSSLLRSVGLPRPRRPTGGSFVAAWADEVYPPAGDVATTVGRSSENLSPCATPDKGGSPVNSASPFDRAATHDYSMDTSRQQTTMTVGELHTDAHQLHGGGKAAAVTTPVDELFVPLSTPTWMQPGHRRQNSWPREGAEGSTHRGGGMAPYDDSTFRQLVVQRGAHTGTILQVDNPPELCLGFPAAAVSTSPLAAPTDEAGSPDPDESNPAVNFWSLDRWPQLGAEGVVVARTPYEQASQRCCCDADDTAWRPARHTPISGSVPLVEDEGCCHRAPWWDDFDALCVNIE